MRFLKTQPMRPGGALNSSTGPVLRHSFVKRRLESPGPWVILRQLGVRFMEIASRKPEIKCPIE